MSGIPYFGEAASFAVAALWALAVILFKKSGESVHPIALNLFKSAMAAVLLLPTLIIMKEPILRDAPFSDYLLLICSGVLGVGIADSMFFRSLNLLGAGMSAIVDCLYSPFIITLSILFLGEGMNFIQVIGVLMILSAILTAASPGGRGALSRHDLAWGIFWGALAMLAMAVGVVMIKPLLNRTPLLWVTEIRVFGGTAFLLLAMLLHRERREMAGSLLAVRNWRYTLTSGLLGGYICMILWLAGMKFTQASTAAALNQTTNIFIFIFAALFLKEAFNRQRIIAILTAVSGALLVTFG